ncbi:unnamed protein product [Ectocarpus sp. 12 AP-2014]
MASTEAIEDGKTIAMLNKIGFKHLGYLGALVKKWEDTADEEVSFTSWVLNSVFNESMKNFAETAQLQCKMDASKMKYLKTELDQTKEELSETRKDISRLVSVNKDLYDKIDRMLPLPHPQRLSIDSIRNILTTFNRENPVAVAKGAGVTFGAGHVKINSVDRLAEFLETVHARKLGVPSNILTTFKVFVLDGKLVTLSDDYHGGVGYSFLWKKKKSTQGAVGWLSVETKKYDPRLGVDPATGVNYTDPETGKMWVYPEHGAGPSEPKKRCLSETSELLPESSLFSAAKKLKSDGGSASSLSGSGEDELVPESGQNGVAEVKPEKQEKQEEQKNEDDDDGDDEEGEEGEVFIP